MRSQYNKAFDATELLNDFQNVHLGTCALKEIHISSKTDFEAPDGQRMARNLFKQIRNHEASYACESKIMLNYEDF